MKTHKIAILTSHPIQYQTPLFRKMVEDDMDIVVYFCWRAGFGKQGNYYDVEFGRALRWDIPLLRGYRYKFLRNYSLNPSSNFWGQINPGIFFEIIKNDYDAIIILGWNSFTNWLAFLAAFCRGLPVFLRGESPFSQEALKSSWKIKIKKVILRSLFFRVAGFLYIGEENRKFYKMYGVPPEKLFFCPYAVDNERFMAAAQDLRFKRQDLRKNVGIGKDDMVILFVGKLIEKKRPMDLLKAYHRLITHNSKFIIHLLFVGDGALRSELERYTREHNLKNIHFAGFINQAELPKYYGMADIFVLPSGGETWGLAVNEAMCLGLPVITSDAVGCSTDLVRNSRNGYVFPVGDVNQLIKQLHYLLNHPYEILRFGRESLAIISIYNYEQDIAGMRGALSAVTVRYSF